MDRRRALLAAGAAASAAYRDASSGTLLLPRATRAGISSTATPPAFAALAPRRRTLATFAARAGRSTLTCTGARNFSSSRRQNQESLRFRSYVLQMFEKFKGTIAKNHAALILKIERNQADLSLDLHKSFHEKMWKWFGAVSAMCSASISVSFLLNDLRISGSEANISKLVEGQDREIKLLWLQLDKLKENLTSQNEFPFDTVCAEQITEGTHVLINDSPCMVNIAEQHSIGDEQLIKLVCSNLFSGQHMELLLPNSYIVKVPYVNVKEYVVVDTNSAGLYVTVREGMVQKEIRAPPATIGALSALRGQKVLVTVTSAMGKDVITSVREAPQGPSLWAWASGFFRSE